LLRETAHSASGRVRIARPNRSRYRRRQAWCRRIRLERRCAANGRLAGHCRAPSKEVRQIGREAIACRVLTYIRRPRLGVLVFGHSRQTQILIEILTRARYTGLPLIASARYLAMVKLGTRRWALPQTSAASASSPASANAPAGRRPRWRWLDDGRETGLLLLQQAAQLDARVAALRSLLGQSRVSQRGAAFLQAASLTSSA
jgi:hypothetical protein